MVVEPISLITIFELLKLTGAPWYTFCAPSKNASTAVDSSEYMLASSLPSATDKVKSESGKLIPAVLAST